MGISVNLGDLEMPHTVTDPRLQSIRAHMKVVIGTQCI